MSPLADVATLAYHEVTDDPTNTGFQRPGARRFVVSWRAFTRSLDEIIQAFVEGQGNGVSGLCDHGRAVTLFAHERLRDVRPTGSGSSLRCSIRLEDRLRVPVERLLKQLEWHGPVMVEFRDDGGDAPWLMDVNGRFWGSVQLAVAAGIDVPRWWVTMLEHGVVPPSPGYREGVTLRWLWGDVKRFLNVLRGAPLGFPGPYPTRRQGLTGLFGAQPDGTPLESWQSADPWPALGEWVQGLAELVDHSRGRLAALGTPRLLEPPVEQTCSPHPDPAGAEPR
jgi:ATP-grasp domain-containing protein